MIQVIEGKHAPKAVRAINPNAPWFIIEDPDKDSLMRRAEVMRDIRRGYLQTENINFTRSSTRVDGKIIHVGHKVDPLIANVRIFG